MPDPRRHEETGEGNLGELSNEDWLEAHQALIASGQLPAEETRFLFDPDRDADTVALDDLTEDGRPR